MSHSSYMSVYICYSFLIWSRYSASSLIPGILFSFWFILPVRLSLQFSSWDNVFFFSIHLYFSLSLFSCFYHFIEFFFQILDYLCHFYEPFVYLFIYLFILDTTWANAKFFLSFLSFNLIELLF